MTPLAFLDTETTSLRHDRRAWEIAVIVREDGKDDAEHEWFVHEHELDLGNADLFSLKIGRFHERHPQMMPDADQSPGSPLRTKVKSEFEVMRQIEALTRGAHIVGAVPNFDTEVLGNRMRAHGICPSWHYHIQDCETLIVGYLAGRGEPVPALPWKSDDLSRLIGVEPPGESERHTALGDARWCLRIWDAVMGGSS